MQQCMSALLLPLSGHGDEPAYQAEAQAIDPAPEYAQGSLNSCTPHELAC